MSVVSLSALPGELYGSIGVPLLPCSALVLTGYDNPGGTLGDSFGRITSIRQLADRTYLTTFARRVLATGMCSSLRTRLTYSAFPAVERAFERVRGNY